MNADRLTHQDEDGRPRMVDVGGKDVTARAAVAEGTLVMDPATLSALREGRTPKGDPLLVARIAGIQAAKRTADLIPLCHPLPLTAVDVDLETDDWLPGVRARATARVVERTGVEMEALTAVAVALLTVYDMLKALDRGMRIHNVRLLHKAGGRTGDWRAPPDAGEPAEPGGRQAMTADEFATVKRALGLTYDEIRDALGQGISTRTLVRYGSGHSPIRPWVARALWEMLERMRDA